jgi:ribosomal protein S18 acetylase RimI-like enzyme
VTSADTTITLAAVTIADRGLLAAWFDGDEDGSTHLGYYQDGDAWLQLLSDDRHGWIAHVDGHPMGFLDLEIEDRTGHFSFYVAPAFRRRGHGTELLWVLGAVCRNMSIDRAVGFVEPTNTASVRTLRAAGFAVSDQPDDEGMLEASKILTNG